MTQKELFKKPKNFGEIADLAGNILAWSVILAFTVILPLYFKDGYDSITSYKYIFLMTVSKYIAIGGAVILAARLFLWGITKEEIKAFRKLLSLDICVLSFTVLSVVSYYFSAHKADGDRYLPEWFYEGALWGTRGWYMGLMSILVFAMVYFYVSRMLISKNISLVPVILAALLIFVWSVLNRYNIAPIDMNYDYRNSSFLGPVGNINWLAGYNSVTFPLLLGWFILSKKKVYRIISGILLIPGYFAVLTNGSDSGLWALLVTMIFLLWWCLCSKEGLKRFLLTAILLCVTGAVIGGLDKLYPEIRMYKGGILESVFGLPSVYAGAFFLLVYISVSLWAKESSEVYPKLGKIYIWSVLFLMVLFVFLIIINTKRGGTLPVIGGNAIFLFNDDWGSSRGITWKIGLKTFCNMDFSHKLIGAGPDTFFMEAGTYGDVYLLMTERFGNARLTNAHCELITLLVNNGILGVVSFVGIMVSAVALAVKNRKTNPVLVIFALSVVSYFANNIFSFQQIVNTPLYFVILGMEGAFSVASERAELLTKNGRKNTIQKGKNKHK